IRLHAVLDRLQWIPDTAPAFESAIGQLGSLFGFDTQEPEAEFGHGPDNLWQIAPETYVVIECKNGVTSGFIAKTDVNQLAGSLNWFRARYGSSAQAIPLMAHPDVRLGRGASSPDEMRVLSREKLAELKAAAEALFSSICSGPWPPSPRLVEEQLT